VLERFAAAGVDYDDVTLTLEREGVDKFAESFASLLDGIRAAGAELAAA
jgi:transaldolase